METVADALATTKLSAPQVPDGFLDRSRLAGLLDAAVRERRALILLSAPAGSGKSTLLAGWVGSAGPGAGWVQLDEGDSDPARFWSYLAAAVDPLVANLSADITEVLPAGAEAVLTTFVNSVAEVEDEVIVVLDDYHLISNPDVHDAVERLVDLRPPNLTVIISTRVDPPFRLGRLRVRDQLTEIRSADLRFGTDEAVALLGRDAAAMDRSEVEVLCERTEGWAAGLVLAGLSLRRIGDPADLVATFAGDDHLVADYLGDELLDTLDPDDRRRLLDVSVLERMSGELVDAVCGTDDGASWLGSQAAANQLLIALDATGTWFRFHHLLRDLLRLEAMRCSSQHVEELHRRAGHWHRANGDLEAAIEHLIQAGELHEAADLVADNATELLNRGQTYTVTNYLDRLGEVADQHEGAAVVRGWVCFVTGRFTEAEHYLEQAARLDVDGVDAGLIAALSTMIHVAGGDITSALEVARRSPEPTQPTHAMVLGGVRVWAGLFDDAAAHLARARDMAAAGPDHFTAAVTPVFQAVSAIEEGDTDSARSLALESIDYAAAHRFANAPQTALAHSVLARTTPEPPGAGDDAVRSAMHGVELARRSPESIMLGYALASAAEVCCGRGDPRGAELLAEARSLLDGCPDPGVAGSYLGRVESRFGSAPAPQQPDEMVEELTDRELAVLRFLPTRLSQREIGDELYVSLNTVKTHCRAVYRKLGVSGRKEAVQTAREQGLV